MTRINLIAPSKLTDQHLIAEYRELPRVYNGVVFTGKHHMNNSPTDYTLSRGHEIFFRDKLGFLAERHQNIVTECLNRSFKLAHSKGIAESTDFIHTCFPVDRLNSYQPTIKALEINIYRILDRVKHSKRTLTFYRQPINVESYCTSLLDWLAQLKFEKENHLST